MKPSLSNIINSISEINKKECKKYIERNYIRSECDFIGIKDNQLRINQLNKLTKKFLSIYKFCDGDLNKFVLLLRKGVYPYENMDSWEKFDKPTIPPKDAFYSKLNFEYIIDKDYAHVWKVWKVFEIKNDGEYHDLYVKQLLADIFYIITFRYIWKL